jgi:uncharacterized membrane protein
VGGRLGFWRTAFTAASTAWAAALFAAPAAGGGAVPLFVAAVYAVGALVCHQQTPRSFQLWSVQLPVCARCTGIYVGCAMAALATFLLPRRPELVRPRLLLLVAAAPTALTLACEWIAGLPLSNVVRALAGAPIGVGVAAIVLWEQRAGRAGAVAALR